MLFLALVDAPLLLPSLFSCTCAKWCVQREKKNDALGDSASPDVVLPSSRSPFPPLPAPSCPFLSLPLSFPLPLPPHPSFAPPPRGALRFPWVGSWARVETRLVADGHRKERLRLCSTRRGRIWTESMSAVSSTRSSPARYWRKGCQRTTRHCRRRRRRQ